MNNEMMMPLMTFLLQSEDLKKQADRIIQEVKTNGFKEFVPGKEVPKELIPAMKYLSADLEKAGEKLKTHADKLKEEMKMVITVDLVGYIDKVLENQKNMSENIEKLMEDQKKMAEKLLSGYATSATP